MEIDSGDAGLGQILRSHHESSVSIAWKPNKTTPQRSTLFQLDEAEEEFRQNALEAMREEETSKKHQDSHNWFVPNPTDPKTNDFERETEEYIRIEGELQRKMTERASLKERIRTYLSILEREKRLASEYATYCQHRQLIKEKLEAPPIPQTSAFSQLQENTTTTIVTPIDRPDIISKLSRVFDCHKILSQILRSCPHRQNSGRMNQFYFIQLEMNLVESYILVSSSLCI